MKIHGLDVSKEEAGKIKKVVAAGQKRMEFISGGMTAEKLYTLEYRLDDIMIQLRDRFGIFFGDKTVDEIHDIRLIIEWFGKQIDPRCNR